MTTQHTPAPWKTGDSDWHTIVGPHTRFNSTHLVGIANVEESDDSNEDASNARLIAAAPELLAALRAIKARIKGVWDDPDLVKFGELMVDSDEDILALAEAAIAQATTNH